MKLIMNLQWGIILLDGVGLNWEPIERLSEWTSIYQLSKSYRWIVSSDS